MEVQERRLLRSLSESAGGWKGARLGQKSFTATRWGVLPTGTRVIRESVREAEDGEVAGGFVGDQEHGRLGARFGWIEAAWH